MAPYVWWFLIVGLAIGGAVVAVLSQDATRRDEDIEAEESDAEAGLIANQLRDEGRPIDRDTVAEVLRAHRDYRRYPPPDRLESWGDEPAPAATSPASASSAAPASSAASATSPASAVDADADREPDEVRHDRGRAADQDLPPA